MSVTNDYLGIDLEVQIKLRISTGVYVNIDNLTELIVFINEENGNIIKRFSKAGVTINGESYTSLTKVDEYTYKLWVDSAVTKIIREQTLRMEINMIQSEAELTDGKLNMIGSFDLIKLLDNQIKKVS